MDDVNAGLLRPTNELCGLTLDDLATLYKKKLREDLEGYFCLQNDGFADEVYNWIVEAPRDEWVLRLVFIKYRDNPYALWANDWRDWYEKIKTNAPLSFKSEEEAAKEMMSEVKRARGRLYDNKDASNDPMVAANTVESHTSKLRRMVRRLFCR
jgi:hypothetical protein